MNSNVLICLSLSEGELANLTANGPRRDLVVLADMLDAPILHRSANGLRKGLLGKLFGPQLRHAWKAAGVKPRPETIFADGEHVGFPLAAALLLRRRRDTRLVILGHLVDKRWKRVLLWLATRMVRQGTLVLHSVTQAEKVAGDTGRHWNVVTLPYQVDTDFWTLPNAIPGPRPMIVAAGSENRDYQTLVEAVRGLDVDVRIAAGSHWARESASAADLPDNVEFINRTLPFGELRELYSRAWMVVVPLFPGANQAGVTTILEGMSMSRPVVVSCTDGQKEVVTGPLVTGDAVDSMVTAHRGPQVLGLRAVENDASGLYVPPGDAAALRRAIVLLLEDPALALAMGRAGRRIVESEFGVDDFARRFAQVILSGAEGPAKQPTVAATAR
ncbi:MAG: glycosyltransferase family 4 protein [Dehalococcoidia bacterium]